MSRNKKLQAKLMEALARFLDNDIQGPLFTDFIARLAVAAKIPSQATLTTVCSRLLGQSLTYKELQRFTGFVATNIEDLRNSVAISSPVAGTNPGPGMIRFTDLKSVDKKSLMLIGIVESGPAYGERVIKIVDPFGPVISAMYRKTGIASKRKKMNPSQVPRSLVGMYLNVDLIARDPSSTELTFRSMGISKYSKSLNVKLLGERKKVCPRNYRHPCYLCSVGTTECFRAVRPVTITISKEKTQDVSGKNTT